MPLSAAQRRHLRGLAHQLKPVVWVGQHGLSDAVKREIELALDSHELIKIKIAAERETRAALVGEICETSRSELIQRIGQMAVLFRRNPKSPRIALPSA
jgi:RNA-binding protein